MLNRPDHDVHIDSVHAQKDGAITPPSTNTAVPGDDRHSSAKKRSPLANLAAQRELADDLNIADRP